MSEMIERVAAALANESIQVRSSEDYFEHMARAAIAAMREPTWPMITEARRVQLTHPDDYENEKGHFAQAYRYMIDAALKE